jgi:hypothetical protein
VRHAIAKRKIKMEGMGREGMEEGEVTYKIINISMQYSMN